MRYISEALRPLQTVMKIAELMLLFVLQAAIVIAPCAAAVDMSSELFVDNENDVIAPLPTLVIQQEGLTGEKLRQLLGQESIHLINVRVDGDVRIGRSDSEPTVFRANGATFNGNFWLSDPQLHLWFDSVKFYGEVDLYLQKLLAFNCFGCTLEMDASFHSAIFQSLRRTHLLKLTHIDY